jgi:hypothetical protein
MSAKKFRHRARKMTATARTTSSEKQLAPAARLDVALDEFARIRRLEVDAAVAVPVVLRRALILGVCLANLLLRHYLRHRGRGCRRVERKRCGGESGGR